MTTANENVESPTERASRSLFVDFASAPGSESELTIESIRERREATSEVMERIPHSSVPPQRWGINE